MPEMKNEMNNREIIDAKFSEDEDFSFKIMQCKNREEVKSFLISNGIDATDKDVDYLAKNIEEVAEVCSELSDEEMEKIIGGEDGTAAKFLKGTGITMATLGGLGFLCVAISWIKKSGDKKGWWGPGKKAKQKAKEKSI